MSTPETNPPPGPGRPSVFPPLGSRRDLLLMLDEITVARTDILRRVDTLSVDRRTDPVYPGTMTVLEILAHLAWAELWMLGWMQSRPRPLPPEHRPADVPPVLAAIRVMLDEAHATAIAFLKSHPESVLLEPCLYGETEQTVGGLYFHLVEHEIGHRAFLLHKLARLGG